MTDIRYVSEFETFLTRNRGDDGDSSGAERKLLGARLHVDLNDIADGQIAAEDMHGHSGFVPVANISERQQLKVFYTDVGQGDASLIEAQGAVIIIDGGPNRGFFDVLEERFADLQAADALGGLPPRARQRINAMVVSHFDQDHYFGLIRVLQSDHYEIGTIYHNGLPRYGASAGKDLDLGDLGTDANGERNITTDLTDLQSARDLLASGDLLTNSGNDNNFAKFLRAAVGAADTGRLDAMQLLVRRDPNAPPELLPDTGPDLSIEILGPLTVSPTGGDLLRPFPDPHDVTATNPNPSPSASHTINGNSVVLRLVHGTSSFLFGGDLNEPSERYLEARYPSLAPFSVDVSKACHHGSSDFHIDFLRAVSPHATVFSSGDNGSHDHPLPDAMGAAAKHSQGDFPLVFSTELARETGSSGVKLGHINARSNGTQIVMAQKKEKPSLKKPWHTFPLPFAGPFG